MFKAKKENVFNEFFAQRERKKLAKKTLPAHIAVIMDGNGRWAKRRGLPRSAGHQRGGEALGRTIQEACSLGIKYLSVYAFSTENWKRPQEEINALQELLKKVLTEQVEDLKKRKIRVRFLGDLSKFSQELQELINKAEKATGFADARLNLNIMLNYGGRPEIVAAVNKIINDNIKQVDEAKFSQYLYTANLPDPDLLVRTSGELRVSNFLLWQIAYSEIWITKKLWPDFNGRLLRQAVKAYQKRDRRKGGI